MESALASFARSARRDFFTRYRRPTFGRDLVRHRAGRPSGRSSRSCSQGRPRPHLDPVPRSSCCRASSPGRSSLPRSRAGVRAITGGSGIASKVYFPRCILPLTNVGTNLYGYVPAVVVFVVAALVFRIEITPYMAAAHPGDDLMVLLTSAFVLVLAALQVYFRDIAYIVGAIVQAWFYGSAVFFPVDQVPRACSGRIILANPATGMVELFRVAFDGHASVDAPVPVRGRRLDVVLFVVRRAAVPALRPRLRRPAMTRDASPARRRRQAIRQVRRRPDARHRRASACSSADEREPSCGRSATSISRSSRARHRRHRPQRVGQVDDARDARRRHRADRGHRPRATAGSRRCCGRRRVPPGADRPRERLHQRDDPRA